MEFETLKKSHLKRNIIIGVIAVAVISAIILNFTRAKYKVTQSIPLVNGTINYTASDLNIVAITIDGEKADSIPDGNYTLTENSYCEVNQFHTALQIRRFQFPTYRQLLVAAYRQIPCLFDLNDLIIFLNYLLHQGYLWQTR